jgi:hypothetical protein
MVQKKKFGPIEAFEEYYMLGERRSLTKLEAKLKTAPERKGPGLRTLKGWSGKFRWQEQVGERNEELRRALSEKTVKGIVEHKTEYLKKIESVIETAFERDGKPIIACEKARDLRDLIDMSLRLLPDEEAKDLVIQFNIKKYDDKKKKDE